MVLDDLTHSYDKAGRRIATGGSFARTGLPQSISTATYNAANQQLTLGNRSMTYDLNGNLATLTDPSGTTTYTWNARNQLVSLNGPNVTANFQYDAFSRRLAKTINGSTTEFVYDGLNPVQELASGTPTANLLTGLGIDEYFSRTDIAGTRSFLPDALGSTLALTDSVGTIQTEYTYEPFGNMTVTGASSTNPFQYTGRENDGTELYHYRARYYHPVLQRFISEDPIGFAGGDSNLYGYVSNDPVNGTDPSGLYGTNDCSHYTQRCLESGGYYYCEQAPYYCDTFRKPPDPDPSRDDDYEGWFRCTRQCLQDCDREENKNQNACPATPDNRGLGQGKSFDCHQKCYRWCVYPGLTGNPF
jgi:RHS repeat-associated protein